MKTKHNILVEHHKSRMTRVLDLENEEIYRGHLYIDLDLENEEIYMGNSLASHMGLSTLGSSTLRDDHTLEMCKDSFQHLIPEVKQITYLRKQNTSMRTGIPTRGISRSWVLEAMIGK